MVNLDVWHSSVSLSLGLVSVAAIIEASELLAKFRLYGSAGIFPLFGGDLANIPAAPAGAALDRCTRWFLLGRAGLALALLFSLVCRAYGCAGVFSTMLLVATMWGRTRWLYGDDGADQMLSIVLIGLSIDCWAIDILNVEWHGVGTMVVAGQVTLAYFTAGVAKLLAPEWRDGRAIVFISQTKTHGREALYRFTKIRPIVCRVLAWGIIVVECAFPMWLVSTSSTVIVLCTMAVFHIAIAGIMRLNLFLIAFVSTYPCVWWCSSLLHGRP